MVAMLQSSFVWLDGVVLGGSRQQARQFEQR